MFGLHVKRSLNCSGVAQHLERTGTPPRVQFPQDPLMFKTNAQSGGVWKNHPACVMCHLTFERVMSLCDCGSRCRVCKVERMPCCVWTSWRRCTTSYSCSCMIFRRRCCAVKSCCSPPSCRVCADR